MYQPKEKTILSIFVNKSRNFLPAWYEKYPWLSLPEKFYVYCRFAQKHNLFIYSKKGDDAFSVKGFDNYKKAIEKFHVHDTSGSHLEAKIKWCSLSNPSIKEQLSSQVAKIQTTHRAGLLAQLKAMHLLLSQGIALRGHMEKEGNLPQLLMIISKMSDNAAVKSWLEEGKYMSHEMVNEMITLMGRKVLREI